MKRILALVALALAAGCAERSSPTSPRFEQRVFNSLGGMRVGESITFRGAAAHEIQFGGQLGPGDYVLIPFHSSEDGSAFADLTLRGTNLNFPPPRAVLPEDGVPSTRETDWSDPHGEMYARMQASTSHLLDRRRRSNAVLPGSIPEIRTELSGQSAFVGQTVALNANANGVACMDMRLRDGQVEAITDQAIIVSDMANPSGGFTRADYENFGRDFDRLVHPTLARFFPAPTDIDGNGRVIIFFTRAVNELTPSGTTGFVGGFFWSRDLFTAGDCVASNQGEIFFVLVPDPNREASPIAHSRETVLQSALSTIGHEYQHLVNAGRRLYVHDSGWEEVWLDEGLSHIAEELLFYAATGLTPSSNIESSSLTGTTAQAINRFMRQNLTRYGLYLLGVKRESPIRPESVLETRGAIWAFLRYVADHSARSDEALFNALADTPLIGVANLEAALGESPLEWIRRWGVSVYTDDRIGRDPFYQQPSWHFRSVLPLLFAGSFPLRTDGLNPDGAVSMDLRAGTSGYVRFGSLGGTPGVLTITARDSVASERLAVTIVRIQ